MKMSTGKRIIVWALAFLPLAVTALLYGRLPESVPIHWDIDGTVTYGGKWSLLLLSALNLIMVALFVVLPKIDPRRQNYNKFRKYYDLYLIATELFMLCVWVVTISEAFWPGSVNVEKVVTVGVSLLFIFIGNIMPKFKNNFFMGIKTPWTLSNDVVWNKTHRLGGFLFVIAGAGTLISSFLFPVKMVFWIMMAFVFAVVLIPAAMSYLWYRRLTVR